MTSGETFSPSHVYLRGMAPPSWNALLVNRNGCGDCTAPSVGPGRADALAWVVVVGADGAVWAADARDASDAVGAAPVSMPVAFAGDAACVGAAGLVAGVAD
jgi:hypothetical protein